jgi:hypothetical protein
MWVWVRPTKTRSTHVDTYRFQEGILDTESDKLYIAQMEGLLETLCQGLEAGEIPLPPELLNWWVCYKASDNDDVSTRECN